MQIATDGPQQLYTIKQIRQVKHQMMPNDTFWFGATVNEHKSHCVLYVVQASTTIIWKQHWQKIYDGENLWACH